MHFQNKNDFDNFRQSVRNRFRFARTPEQAAFLEAIRSTSEGRVVTLKKGFSVHRAQIGHGWRREEISPGEFDELPAPYSPERMVPDSNHAGDGRVSAKGISCLYLSTTEETAAMEVRPLVGSLISMGCFVLERNVRVVDCSQQLIGNLARWFQEEWSPEDIEKQVWTDINNAFSEPTGREDTALDYVPTQIIAETLRLQGYDGIGYKSSVDERGLNLALFDFDAVKLVRRSLYKVSLKVDLSIADNPSYLKDGDWVRNVIKAVYPLNAKPEV